MGITCLICQKWFKSNLNGQLTSHLLETHQLSLEEYVVKTTYNGKPPVCVCGLCSDRPVFYRGKFKRYAFGHNVFDKRAELFVAKHGQPICRVCGDTTGFHRGQPKKYCSFTCQGKQNGFSKLETQQKIKQTVHEKYGVDNVSKLAEVRKRISVANMGHTVTVTEETRRKHVEHSKRLWSNPEYVKKWFGSSWGRLSKLHQRLRKELKLDELGFLSEQVIGNRLVDELLLEKMVVIEINGDYIHANPKHFKPDDIIRIPGESYTAQEKWDRDQKKVEYLQAKGYTVFVVWESDDIEDWKKRIEEVYA